MQIGIGPDIPLSGHDCSHPVGWHVKIPRQRMIDMPRVAISSVGISPGLIGGAITSMVVDNFDVICNFIYKAEEYPPLFTDPDSVLAVAFSTERFKPIRTHLHWIVDVGHVGKNDNPGGVRCGTRTRFWRSVRIMTAVSLMLKTS